MIYPSLCTNGIYLALLLFPGVAERRRMAGPRLDQAAPRAGSA